MPRFIIVGYEGQILGTGGLFGPPIREKPRKSPSWIGVTFWNLAEAIKHNIIYLAFTFQRPPKSNNNSSKLLLHQISSGKWRPNIWYRKIKITFFIFLGKSLGNLLNWPVFEKNFFQKKHTQKQSPEVFYVKRCS